MCQLKTLVGLQSLARYNVKHHRHTYTTPNALDEDVIVDNKQKWCSTTLKWTIKDVIAFTNNRISHSN